MTLRAAEAPFPPNQRRYFNGFVWGYQRERDPRDGLRRRDSPTIPLDTMV
jgi:hypothetical protein